MCVCLSNVGISVYEVWVNEQYCMSVLYYYTIMNNIEDDDYIRMFYYQYTTHTHTLIHNISPSLCRITQICYISSICMYNQGCMFYNTKTISEYRYFLSPYRYDKGTVYMYSICSGSIKLYVV